MRARASSRSPKHTGAGFSTVGDGTMVRHARKASDNDGSMTNNNNGTLVRTRQNSAAGAGVRHHRKASSSDVNTGTMVRHRPASRRNSFASEDAEGLEISGKSIKSVKPLLLAFIHLLF